MRVTNSPYASRTEGVYAKAAQPYNGAPVFTHTDRYGLTWSMYMRAYDRYVLDWNAIDERWSGTVAYTNELADGGSAWSATWTSWSSSAMTVEPIINGITFPPPPAPPPPAPAATGSLSVSGAPYNSLTDGVYTRSAATHAGSPVYARTDSQGRVWSLYRRSYDRWVLDYNEVSEFWRGTVAYSSVASGASPTSVSWSASGMQVAEARPGTARTRSATVPSQSDSSSSNNGASRQILLSDVAPPTNAEQQPQAVGGVQPPLGTLGPMAEVGRPTFIPDTPAEAAPPHPQPGKGHGKGKGDGSSSEDDASNAPQTDEVEAPPEPSSTEPDRPQEEAERDAGAEASSDAADESARRPVEGQRTSLTTPSADGKVAMPLSVLIGAIVGGCALLLAVVACVAVRLRRSGKPAKQRVVPAWCNASTPSASRVVLGRPVAPGRSCYTAKTTDIKVKMQTVAV